MLDQKTENIFQTPQGTVAQYMFMKNREMEDTKKVYTI